MKIDSNCCNCASAMPRKEWGMVGLLLSAEVTAASATIWAKRSLSIRASPAIFFWSSSVENLMPKARDACFNSCISRSPELSKSQRLATKWGSFSFIFSSELTRNSCSSQLSKLRVSVGANVQQNQQSLDVSSSPSSTGMATSSFKLDCTSAVIAPLGTFTSAPSQAPAVAWPSFSVRFAWAKANCSRCSNSVGGRLCWDALLHVQPMSWKQHFNRWLVSLQSTLVVDTTLPQATKLGRRWNHVQRLEQVFFHTFQITHENARCSVSGKLTVQEALYSPVLTAVQHGGR